MMRLRELALAAGVAIAGMMGALVLTPDSPSPIHMSFRPDIARNVVRLASNQAAAALGLAAAGTGELNAPPPKPVIDPAVAQQADAADRLRQKIPAALYPYFDVYLYVSKASDGSLAQHMFIFHKASDNSLVFEQSFPVSTGRERHERYFTSTPAGLFQLDPNRFEIMHHSRTWGGAAMAHAMFLNATIHGRQTGVALHSAGGHAYLLGQRASGGCVRLPPEKAAELFERFQASERGQVPIFAYDAALRRTDPDGRILRDASGAPVLTGGYRVLLFIEDYPGGPALVAVLS